MNIKILVAHHKPGLVIKDNVYFPIQVGKALHPDLNLGVQGDDTGENISFKNSIYCEMTAWYWAWKNVKADYVGLCHYRRYYTFRSISFIEKIKGYGLYMYFKLFGNIFRPGEGFSLHDCINVGDPKVFQDFISEFSKELIAKISNDNFDVIIPSPYKYPGSNVQSQFLELGKVHFDLLATIVKEMRPDVYPYYLKSLKETKLFAANMVIFKYSVFQKYSEFIFPILEEHEKRTLQSGWCYDLYKEKCYARMSGYLAELLTNSFVLMLKVQGAKVLQVNSCFCSNL